MKKIAILLTLITALFAYSCENVKTLCPGEVSDDSVDSLIAELEAEQSNNTVTRDFTYLAEANHNGNTVFILANCCPYCLSLFPVYDCSGQEIGHIGDDTFNPNLLNSAKIVWRSENNQCSL